MVCYYAIFNQEFRYIIGNQYLSLLCIPFKQILRCLCQ
uniref:Uncharacterized protein n=1 Tax=Arundo donax TaxID=35708 RepID=A0A0A9FX15_ARUDO